MMGQHGAGYVAIARLAWAHCQACPSLQGAPGAPGPPEGLVLCLAHRGSPMAAVSKQFQEEAGWAEACRRGKCREEAGVTGARGTMQTLPARGAGEASVSRRPISTLATLMSDSPPVREQGCHRNQRGRAHIWPLAEVLFSVGLHILGHIPPIDTSSLTLLLFLLLHHKSL